MEPQTVLLILTTEKDIVFYIMDIKQVVNLIKKIKKIYVSNSVCTKDWSHKTIPKVNISKNDISKKSHYRL
mgnify:CR=1 FL=1